MTDWLFTRQARLIGAGVLLAAIVVAVIFRDAAALANITSIVGLAVSVLGFVVTIWTVIDARQQIKESSERSRVAINQANEETRRVLRGVSALIRANDCADLRNGVEDIRQAARNRSWERAVYRCHDCRLVAIRLAEDQQLVGQEIVALGAVADNLKIVQRFIERNRLNEEKKADPLQDIHVNKLDAAINVLARIQARLYHESLQLTEGSLH